jgi:hypothetical protein
MVEEWIFKEKILTSEKNVRWLKFVLSTWYCWCGLIKNNEMDGHVTWIVEQEIYIKFCFENLKGRGNLGDVDGWIILNCSLES